MENNGKHTPKRTLTGEIVFLMLSLPIGLVYFTVAIVGFLLGVGTLVIWIGLPILFALFYIVHGMAAVERKMVSSLLGMPHPEQPNGRVPVRGLLRRFGSLLRDPYTWMDLLYMLFIKLPLGILSFTLTLTLLISSVALTLLPLVYLLNLFINLILLKNGVQPDQSIIIPYVLEIHGGFDPLMFLRSFVGVPLGLVLCLITRLTISGLASFSGVLANALLGPGTTVHNMQPHTQNYAPPMQRTFAEQPRARNYEMPARMLEQQVYTD